jgi:hypothetical protein
MKMLPSSRRLRMATFALGPVIAGVVAFFAVSATTREHPVSLRGITAEGKLVKLRVDGDGDVTNLATRITAKCDRGREDWGANWTAALSGQNKARFSQDGNAVTITDIARAGYEDGTKAVVALSAQGIVAGDRRMMDGFLRMTVRFTKGGRETSTCDSEPVRFATGPGALRRLDAWL